MAFIIKILFYTALVYVCRGEAPLRHDSYSASALSAPSASYGSRKSRSLASYGPPSTSYGVPFSSGSLNLGQNLPPAPQPAYGPPSDQEGSLLLDETRSPAAPPVSSGSLNLGEPRVIGSTVQVGRPVASATRYELQSVVQNVVRRVPIEVVRHVQVAVPQPVAVPVRQEIRVPVPQPYPVQVEVPRQVPYNVYQTQNIEVERRVPYEVVRQVPVEVIRKVPVPVDRPYEVIRKIHVPIEKHIHVPVAVWKPYPINIIKHVTHYQKKKCCGW
ncbi:uncharacterized protein LOC134653698 [Cydia amplana]|uniref:uncharacterized protein LOC134653698 n=1 Tax=Cydia amplana TaxID=1869771 RepID=UPI002FE60BC4